MIIRRERGEDERAVSDLITCAFAGAAHTSGDEAAIVERLRRDGDLEAAFVATDGEQIIGHVAFSPVLIDVDDCGWFGVGPVAVVPQRQRQCIGSAMILRGLDNLRATGARGCVVLGDPRYYGRFGFEANSALTFAGAPAEYFQRIVFHGESPHGVVSYAPAFG